MFKRGEITRRNFLEISTLSATGLSLSLNTSKSSIIKSAQREKTAEIYGLRKISSAKLVCVGPVNTDWKLGGWYSFKKGSELFGYETRFYTYDEFENDFNLFFKDDNKRKEAKNVADEFVSKARRVVEPTEEKLLRAGIFHLVLMKYIKENEADWVTVNCLSPLLRNLQATPCMSFSILNDSGIVATCEADPTEGPLHYLMNYIAGKPTFFQDPAVNEEDGTLILAHCTSPTKMLGFDKPPLSYDVRTHHESNFSATLKPTFEKGIVTVAGFSRDFKKMLIVRGNVVGSPDLRICRAQVEVKVDNTEGILNDWQGFHWVLAYGDYVKELKMICDQKEIIPLIHQ